jgi:hypothetical protein
MVQALMISSTVGNYKVWMIDIVIEMIVAAAHVLDDENYCKQWQELYNSTLEATV